MCLLLEDEALSFQAMPDDCPIQYLDFGILTNVIAPKVKKNRRDMRELRKEFLIKNILNVNLKQCLQELYKLSRMYPRYSVINKLRCYEMNNKKSMMKLVDTHDIPLIYLEESYEKQLGGPTSFSVDDWIHCKNHYGVVTHLYGKTLRVRLVKTSWYYSESGEKIIVPMFHKWSRDSRNHIYVRSFSVWETKKIGHDKVEWKHLRNNLIKQYNANLEKRKELWERMKNRLIQQSVLDSPLRSRETLRSYHLTWFQMRVNVLDKSMWENLRPLRQNNPTNIHSLWWYSNHCMPTTGANLMTLRKTVLDMGLLN
tara:strand:+ start:89 stop:1024 length:936 start_codon:yes stop_codon:yes gene_type:complete